MLVCALERGHVLLCVWREEVCCSCMCMEGGDVGVCMEGGGMLVCVWKGDVC